MMLSANLARFFSSLAVCLALIIPAEAATVCQTGISPAYSTKVVNSFIDEDFVNGTIPSIHPTVRINATFAHEVVHLGNIIDEQQHVPQISFSSEAGRSTATNYSMFLVFTQWYSFNPTKKGHLLYHMAHLNCGEDVLGEVVTPYKFYTAGSSSPFPYVFFLYREPEGYQPLPTERAPFKVAEYAKEAGLTLVGGNWFNAQP